jgi:hypothetical protein
MSPVEIGPQAVDGSAAASRRASRRNPAASTHQRGRLELNTTSAPTLVWATSLQLLCILVVALLVSKNGIDACKGKPRFNESEGTKDYILYGRVFVIARDC